jgi:hypothetical protein
MIRGADLTESLAAAPGFCLPTQDIVPPRFHYPSRIVLHRYGYDPETIDARLTGVGYAHELAEVTERVADGDTESQIMPLAQPRALSPATTAAAMSSIGRALSVATSRSRLSRSTSWCI